MSTQLTYQMEPELRIGIPRSARVKAESWVELRIVALIALVVALVIIWFAARDLNDLYALRAHGITQQAVITDKRTFHGKTTSYYIAYSLQAGNTRLEDEDQVSETLYEEKRQGDFMPVTFLAGQPQTHRLGRVGDRRVARHTVDWALGLLGGAGIFGLLCLAMLYEYRKELRLTRDGIPVPGIIRDCVAPQSTKVTDYTVTYRFPSPLGEQTQTCSVSAEVGKRLAAGKTVTVLYNADNLRHSRLYCTLLYTEVA